MPQNLTHPYTVQLQKEHDKRISQCNDESLEPTSSAETIFDIIATFGNV